MALLLLLVLLVFPLRVRGAWTIDLGSPVKWLVVDNPLAVAVHQDRVSIVHSNGTVIKTIQKSATGPPSVETSFNVVAIPLGADGVLMIDANDVDNVRYKVAGGSKGYYYKAALV
eukprot:Sspe_Gene.111550::Locus_93625_Transcript_1_1_Confidence_1.000_Length_398::g.111550::m.111550